MSLHKILFFSGIMALWFALPAIGAGEGKQDIEVVVSDIPSECLSLEQIIFISGQYLLADGRNNTGRVKIADSNGNITRALISSVGLPGAASLPVDYQPSPFGMDRIVCTDERIWCLAAPWSGAFAEEFDYKTGNFLKRVPSNGLRASGLVKGSKSSIMAVCGTSLIRIDSKNPKETALSGVESRIDCIAYHPFGYVVYSYPWLALVDDDNIMRWRINLISETGFHFSVVDVSAGSAGTIAVTGIECDISDESVLNDYLVIREECIKQKNEEALFTLERRLRSNFGTGFKILFFNSQGINEDIVDINLYPVSCSVDGSGRAHILCETETGWQVSIIDPKINQGYAVFNVPAGTPSLISPHRITYDSDGILYWDDIFISKNEISWGIWKKIASSDELFSLGRNFGRELVFSELLSGSTNVVNALEIDDDGSVWIGLQQFPWNLDKEENIQAYKSFVLSVAPDGKLLQRLAPPDVLGEASYAVELHKYGNRIFSLWAFPDAKKGKAYFIDKEGNYTAKNEIGQNMGVSDGRIEKLKNGYLSWVEDRSKQNEAMIWWKTNDELVGKLRYYKMEAVNCRLLASDESRDRFYVTIDDGEIFRINAGTQIVDGIWDNRFESGAPGHRLDDASYYADSLAILDRENRAIFSVPDDLFSKPKEASAEEVENAIKLVKNRLEEWKHATGEYPLSFEEFMGKMFGLDEMKEMKKAFIGKGVYHYKPVRTGYSFMVWSAAKEQPIIICEPFGDRVVL